MATLREDQCVFIYNVTGPVQNNGNWQVHVCTMKIRVP